MKFLLATAALILCANAALAASVRPVSYSVINGDGIDIGRDFNFFDDSYDGQGNVTQSGWQLTGGTGDLTDGVIATQNWNANGQTSADPYVGWKDRNFGMSFVFDKAYQFDTVTFHVDDSNGAGGVTPPFRIIVNRSVSSFLPDPSDGAPFAHVIDLSSLAPTDVLGVSITRRSDWIMLSEVEFTVAAPVPVPAAGLMLLAGLGALAGLRRKRG